MQLSEKADTATTTRKQKQNNLIFYIQKNEPVRIREIQFEGVHAFTEPALKHKMKDTKERVKFEMDSILQFKKNFKKLGYKFKWYEVPGGLSPVSWYHYLEHFVNLNIFKASKFRRKEYEDDKKKDH